MRARITSSRRGVGAASGELAGVDSGWEDAAIVAAAAGVGAARLGRRFRRCDGWKPLAHVGLFRLPASAYAD